VGVLIDKPPTCSTPAMQVRSSPPKPPSALCDRAGPLDMVVPGVEGVGVPLMAGRTSCHTQATCTQMTIRPATYTRQGEPMGRCERTLHSAKQGIRGYCPGRRGGGCGGACEGVASRVTSTGSKWRWVCMRRYSNRWHGAARVPPAPAPHGRKVPPPTPANVIMQCTPWMCAQGRGYHRRRAVRSLA
jgi:hypothetical protein